MRPQTSNRMNLYIIFNKTLLHSGQSLPTKKIITDQKAVTLKARVQKLSKYHNEITVSQSLLSMGPYFRWFICNCRLATVTDSLPMVKTYYSTVLWSTEVLFPMILSLSLTPQHGHTETLRQSLANLVLPFVQNELLWKKWHSTSTGLY